eukprot:2940375-Alexandrium_andersonii.AAC.1
MPTSFWVTRWAMGPRNSNSGPGWAIMPEALSECKACMRTRCTFFTVVLRLSAIAYPADNSR